MALLTLVMLGSARMATAQVAEGFYYIVSNPDQTFYLCPAQDPENPATA